MNALVLRADARALPLAAASVDLIVTSPPYFSLRSYTDNGVHYAGQVGAEPTPAEFVDSLIECTREMIRVLKPSGSIWLNLGDKYAGSRMDGSRAAARGQRRQARAPMPAKSLMGLPWRYALRCIDELGLILRAEVIWSKPNGLPESVTDRVRRSHEQWFHFVTQPRYYSAVDRIREPHKDPNDNRHERGRGRNFHRDGNRYASASSANPLGALPGSVWTIPTQPLKVPAELGIDHFAAFPMEFPRRIITGWSPEGICTACGEARQLTVVRDRAVGMDVSGAIWSRNGRHSNITGRQHLERSEHVITGEACACPDVSAPTTPAVVLDPFAGTGTTALVASALGRVGVSVDLSADYCRLARWRTTDRGQIAAAMQVDKPTAQVQAQLDLFGEVA